MKIFCRSANLARSLRVIFSLGIGTSHSYNTGVLNGQYQEIMLLKIFCRSANLARSLRVIFSLGIGTSHSYNTDRGFKGIESGDRSAENLLSLS